MSVNLYNKLEPETGYKLLQLSDDLLDAFQTGPVKFKALSDDAGNVVLCSEDKTWVIKQRNHSNTVILMNEFAPTGGIPEDKINTFGLPRPGADWAGFSTLDSELEPRLVDGSIDVTQLDIYHGKDVPLTRKLAYFTRVQGYVSMFRERVCIEMVRSRRISSSRFCMFTI